MKKKRVKKNRSITRQIHWDADGSIRRFRCFNIKHYVDDETAECIISQNLKYDSSDYDDELIKAVNNAQTKYLERTIPEIIFEIFGSIADSKIEDLICDEISEATGWLHEGFEFEEIKMALNKPKEVN